MKKLGFCFLCQSDIHQLSLWEQFFENNYDKCNIYIHCYEKEKVTQEFIKKYHINKSLPTQWGDIYDVIRYIMELSLKNNDYKLILVSESTIPIKPFQYIYDYLTHDSKGFLNYIPHLSNNDNEKYCLLMQYQRYINNIEKIDNFTKNIDISHWYHNETWIIFNQEMMEIIFNDNYYINFFKQSFVYDENYPMYLYSLNNKIDLFHNIKTTYTYWYGDITGKRHPKLYDKVDENIILLFMNPNLLFARKFTEDSNVVEYLPYVFNKYQTNPKFIADKCYKIFDKAVDDIELKDNEIFTYLSLNEINETPYCKFIYKLMKNDIIHVLNDKKLMGELLNDERITPNIYLSSEKIIKENYDSKKLWFIKYRYGCSGKSILCKTTEDLKSIEISENFIIQEGITNLDLYQGYKYTLRIFILIHNQKLYLYSGIKKRIHNEKYCKNTLNYNIHVCGGEYLERIPLYLDINDDLYIKLKKHLILVKNKIHHIIEQSDEYIYSLIGIDYLVKTNQDLILIEMNPHPQILRNPEYVNEKINIPLMQDTINLIVNNKINNYELL